MNRTRARCLDWETINKNRDKLIGSFEILRKRGYIARANYYCCSSCAGYAIGQRVSDMTAEKAAKVKGCVFWNQQDECGIEDDGTLYLAFGSIGTSTHGDVGLPTIEVGREIVSLLEQCGLSVKWDGKESTRILIDLTHTLLGPCANCGASMQTTGSGWARCLKCGYDCKHAHPETWCECEEQKAKPNAEYIVWEGDGHGWACSHCGQFVQTG